MDSDSPPHGSQLVPGLEGRLEADVRQEWTRAHFEPHLPAVFSTPAMIGLMEGAVSRAVAPALPEGAFTVGTHIDVEHLKAIPVGAHVEALARLAEVNGRVLLFDVEARSGGNIIGRGRITHTIVSLDRFARLASSGSGPAPSDKKS
jgi:fluoroacetyl-CoA thioesterase